MEFAVTLQAAGTAVALGVTHAVEPDHVAGISALTGDGRNPRRSAAIGGLFAVGHAALVLGWVALWYVLGGLPVPAGMESVGMIVVGLLLSLLAVGLGVTGLRRYVHRHEHAHDGQDSHTHLHLHVPFGVGLPGGRDLPGSRHLPGGRHFPVGTLAAHRHDHTLRGYLVIGLVGALFTLSPPLSMVAFVSLVLPTATGPAVAVVVGAYAVGIVATMCLVGGGVGTLGRLLDGHDTRVHAALEVATAILVFGYGVSVLWSHLGLAAPV